MSMDTHVSRMDAHVSRMDAHVSGVLAGQAFSVTQNIFLFIFLILDKNQIRHLFL